jgi:hypothetical protein
MRRLVLRKRVGEKEKVKEKVNNSSHTTVIQEQKGDESHLENPPAPPQKKKKKKEDLSTLRSRYTVPEMLQLRSLNWRRKCGVTIAGQHIPRIGFVPAVLRQSPVPGLGVSLGEALLQLKISVAGV